MEKPTSKTKTTARTLLEICVLMWNEVCCCEVKKIMSMIFQFGTKSSQNIDQKLDDMFRGTADVMSHVDISLKGQAP
jgi:hypothetical protein